MGYTMIKLGDVVVKGANWLCNDKIGSYGLEIVNWVHNDKLGQMVLK